MSFVTTTQISEYTQAQATNSILNFGLGQPSEPLLPLKEFREAVDSRFNSVSPLFIQYGAGPGYLSFRQSLSQFLTKHYESPVQADELFVTNGNSGALATVLGLICCKRHSDVVVVEDPTYFLVEGVLSDLGLKLTTVSVDDNGLNVDELEKMLKDGLRPSMIYTIPVFHNPKGCTLSAARKEKLVELAYEYDFYIAADEPYQLLHFGKQNKPPLPFASFDRSEGRVFSLGTFSKILAPGLRLGWVHAKVPLIERLKNLGVVRSGGCYNPIIAGVTHSMIDAGKLEQHINFLQAQFQERCGRLCASLRKYIPNEEFIEPTGGYFVFVRIPGIDSVALLEKTREVGVIYHPGPRCSVKGGFGDCMRLSFAFYTPDEIEAGIAKLGEVIKGQLSS